MGGVVGYVFLPSHLYDSSEKHSVNILTSRCLAPRSDIFTTSESMFRSRLCHLIAPGEKKLEACVSVSYVSLTQCACKKACHSYSGDDVTASPSLTCSSLPLLCSTRWCEVVRGRAPAPWCPPRARWEWAWCWMSVAAVRFVHSSLTRTVAQGNPVTI